MLCLMFPEFSAAMATATKQQKQQKQRLESRFKREDKRKEELAKASPIFRIYLAISLNLLYVIFRDQRLYVLSMVTSLIWLEYCRHKLLSTTHSATTAN